MRKYLLYLMAVSCSLCLKGCIPAETDLQDHMDIQTEQTSRGEISGETTGEETGVLSESSILTGLPVTEEVRNTRPLAVMFNNIKEGCPQWGIGSADIVYEAPVEGRITRLMGIYENYKALDKIGSIRSSRDYFVYFAMEYDALYAHFGQATVYVGDLLNSDRIDNISGAVAGIDRPSTNAFTRSDERKAPHNVYITNEGLFKDIEKFQYRTTKNNELSPKFTFYTDDSTYAFPYAENATLLYPGGKETEKANGFSRVQAWFEYDEETGTYKRNQYGGPQIDEATGQQLEYSNVIFQYCYGEVRDENDYLAFNCHGDEDRMVRVFTQGKMIPGTWSRLSDDEPAVYTDYDGDPIPLTPGKTWICIIWDEYRDDVIYE